MSNMNTCAVERSRFSDIPVLCARMKRLRVAIVSDALSGRNGVDVYYRDLVNSLQTQVARIDLVNPDPENPIGKSWFSVPMPGDTTQKIYFPAIVKLYRELLTLAPSIIVVPTPGPFGLLGAFVARHINVPIIAGLHTDLESLAGLYWNRFAGCIGQYSIETASRLLFHYADSVIINADSIYPAAWRLGANHVQVLGTPLAQEFITTPVTPPSGASTHILFVGRLAPEKNIKAILDAAERFPKLSFTLAGRGPLEALVRQQSSQLSNLNYAGHLSRTGIVKLLDEADVVILPSLVEAFGTAALEAMSRARLVLVSKACGISSWPQLCAGLWVMREHESLCEALAHITVLDQSTKTRIASTAHHAALKFHQSAVTGWLNLLTDCARP